MSALLREDEGRPSRTWAPSAQIQVDDATSGTTVTFSGAVVLQNNVALDTDAATGTDNNITFQGSVAADDASAHDRGLSIVAGAGQVSFLAGVGTTANGSLADCDVSAGQIQLTNNVVVDDQGGNTVTFTGAVRLDSNVTIDTTGRRTISCNSSAARVPSTPTRPATLERWQLTRAPPRFCLAATSAPVQHMQPA